MGRRQIKFDEFDYNTMVLNEEHRRKAQLKIDRRKAAPQIKKFRLEQSKLCNRKKYALIKYVDLKTIEYFTNGTFECSLCYKVQSNRRQWVVKRDSQQDKKLKLAFRFIVRRQTQLAKVMINDIIKNTKVYCKSCYWRDLYKNDA